jgi:hypothetical protein
MLIRFLTVAVVALSLCPAALAAEKDADGWKELFNGKSLDGWKKTTEHPDSIMVKDGAIVTHGERAHLFYVGESKPFKNFELEAEVMTRPNSNSGIFIHTKYQGEGWPTQGYECQVNNSFNRDPQKTGGLYNTVKVLEAPAKDNEWFKYYIKVDGKHVTIKINDKTTVDWTEPDDKAGPLKLSQGTFALQAHDPGSTVMYRSIKVKRLP